jgi:hypothetical protein
MRQFIIKKKLNAPVQDGNTIHLKITSDIFPDMRLHKGTNTFNIPFAIELMNPNDKELMAFQFKLAKELTQRGVTLLGAYEEDGSISVGVFNMNENEIRLREKQDFLMVEVLEKVSLKAVNDFALKPTPEPTKGKKLGRKS